MEAIVFMFCITLHNIEEALWLVDWQAKHNKFNRRICPKEQFVFAALGVTLLAYLVAGLHMLYPDNMWFGYAFVGFVGAMLINAVMPHLLLTIITRSYCPGVFTGCFLIVPLYSIILTNAVDNNMKIVYVILATVIVGVVLLVAIALFKLLARWVLAFLKKEGGLHD